ncbi:Uncharacterized HNH endonuclease L247 [Durusdinium trenchii]|uniref:Uncharacterized HNH endonuclease L247 n=1 Tax=Durusdinium trenchii TaxID=1381693 RepID=A0ABP0IY73_9DINO
MAWWCGSTGRRWRIAVFAWLLTCHLSVRLQVISGLEPIDKLSPTRKVWQVSSHGRFSNARGRKSYGTLLKSGYRKVGIRGKFFRAHRLVAVEFHGPPPSNTAQVNHKDGNCSNNHKDNLEWVTPSQNVRISYDNPSRGTAGPSNSKPVIVRHLTSQQCRRFSSAKEASEKLGINYWTVSALFRREAQLGCLEFKYMEPENQMLEGEKWKPMIDPRSGKSVPGRFVSSLGRIKKKDGRISTGHRKKDGYCYFNLFHGGTILVHRLVARAFLGPPPSPEHEVNHKDLDRGNNAVHNLEYVTHSENVAHRYNSMKAPHPLSVPILSRAHGSSEEWRTHASMATAARDLGLHQPAVQRCVRGKRRQTGGYEFRLAEKEEVMVDTLPGEEWRDINVTGNNPL